jgi:hypothetical protein
VPGTEVAVLVQRVPADRLDRADRAAGPVAQAVAALKASPDRTNLTTSVSLTRRPKTPSCRAAAPRPVALGPEGNAQVVSAPVADRVVSADRAAPETVGLLKAGPVAVLAEARAVVAAQAAQASAARRIVADLHGKRLARAPALRRAGGKAAARNGRKAASADAVRPRLAIRWRRLR